MNRDDTKRLLKIITISIIVLIIVTYAFFTSLDYLKGPKIIIKEPANGSTIATSSVEIIGIASRIQNITINGKPVIIDKEGNFNEILILVEGYNVSLFKAVDKFDRTAEYKLELVYEK